MIVEDGIIQTPVFIYRIAKNEFSDGYEKLWDYKDFLARRIEEEGYPAECFKFETDLHDGYFRLIARPIQFSGMWLEPYDDDEE